MIKVMITSMCSVMCLMACSGGSATDGSVSGQSGTGDVIDQSRTTHFAVDDNGDTRLLSEVVKQGENFELSSSAGFRSSTLGSTVVSSVNNDFNVEVATADEGKITVSLDGEVYTLTDRDIIPTDSSGLLTYRLGADEGRIVLFNHTNAARSPQYSAPVIFFNGSSQNVVEVGIGVMGLKTRPDAIGEATYNGNVGIFSVPTAVSISDYGFDEISGDIALRVDASGNFSGEVSRLSMETSEGERSTLSGIAILQTSQINQGSFSGAIMAGSSLQSSLDLSDSDIGTYDGDFFGSTGQSAAGVISLNASTRSDGDYVGYGVFSASKN